MCWVGVRHICTVCVLTCLFKILCEVDSKSLASSGVSVQTQKQVTEYAFSILFCHGSGCTEVGLPCSRLTVGDVRFSCFVGATTATTKNSEVIEFFC